MVFKNDESAVITFENFDLAEFQTWYNWIATNTSYNVLNRLFNTEMKIEVDANNESINFAEKSCVFNETIFSFTNSTFEFVSIDKKISGNYEQTGANVLFSGLKNLGYIFSHKSKSNSLKEFIIDKIEVIPNPNGVSWEFIITYFQDNNSYVANVKFSCLENTIIFESIVNLNGFYSPESFYMSSTFITGIISMIDGFYNPNYSIDKQVELINIGGVLSAKLSKYL